MGVTELLKVMLLCTYNITNSNSNVLYVLIDTGFAQLLSKDGNEIEVEVNLPHRYIFFISISNVKIINKKITNVND